MTARIRIGTRGSKLALWQAQETARLLRAAGYESELVIVKTTGDKRTDVSLASIGGKGLFIKELEEALERREIGVAVHSLKDVPSIIPDHFTLAGFLERADPRDAWVHPENAPIATLPAGSIVGTSSPRRRAQLLALFPHLRVEDIRGNVDTRIEKARRGEYAGIVLAAAGLHRLGRANEITSYFSIDEMIPAAGQGIVTIECLAENETAIAAARAINHAPSETAALTERGVLQQFGTRLDCYSEIAVHATPDGQVRTFFHGTRSAGVPPATAGRPGRQKNGTVYLVGAGPGDARLLTLRAAELLKTAGLVALDALVSKDIAALIPKTTEITYVGKRAAAHALPQDQINQLLIDEARKGKTVVRLKGGDPFVFGRGGEEAEELVAAGIPVEIVPGISSAIAGPAYAGIPVTHRAFATSVTLVTAHEADSGSTGIKWPALAQLDGTIVFMMGFANLPNIVHRLMEHGMSPDRGCAVISKGTRADQRTVAGTLRNIEMQVAEAKLETPALIVVGDVVKLRESINWFESKPLFGKRVVVTRAREQASELKRLLEDSGADVLQFPTIEIAPPLTFDSLDVAVEEKFDWLIFTSTNGVQNFFERLFAKGKDVRALAGTKVAAVGQSTATELRNRGIAPDVVPERFISTELLPLLAEDQRGIRTVVIRAEEGRDELLDELRRRGGEVHLAVAYRTVASDESLEDLRASLDSIDVVTFTSASTVDNFFARLSEDERGRVLQRATIASIGETTSAAIRRYGKEPDVVAEKATIQALHDAVFECGHRTP
ncbi:MAG TPA: uroporphyrinogen-III C-methyltransferase [Thermoanaerobaculia bacterium]|nr:uroporphyrinogen-III C-methyltransferase [Thermoanaerobaculia bacterium]